MIDIHSHVLFDMDDGAEDVETSIELCRDSYMNGCDSLVLTPHFFEYSYLEDFIEERDMRITLLREALEKEHIPLEVLPGAELFLSDRVFGADNLDELTINGTKYMLCEMPLTPFDTHNVIRWFDELKDRGYVPILAHPERYYEFHQNYDLIDEIIDRGIIFQVNLDSLIGENGSSAQEMSIDMVRRGIAQIIASDAHDLDYRHTRLVEKLNQLPNNITEDLVEKCLIENPQKIINNQDI
jgi:protein-tyrosine phosphatase